MFVQIKERMFWCLSLRSPQHVRQMIVIRRWPFLTVDEMAIDEMNRLLLLLPEYAIIFNYLDCYSTVNISSLGT